jgi:curved DNA-binding protein CbpA
MPESGGTRLTEEELKKQYIKLAKIYHPDANRQDATTVRSKFVSFNLLGTILAALRGLFEA